MASTIQLKTGTGSAVPSSLTQGEVAINIDNGLVYYGSGSGNAVKKLDSFTHITASGTISAAKLVVTEITSSRITSSVVVTSGSNIFGDTIADTHTFNGHITGSNISASGTGSFGMLIIDQNITASGNISSSATGSFGMLFVDQNITASNISASGTILSENITVTDITVNDDLTVNDNIQLADNSKIISSNNSTTFIELQNDDGFNIQTNNVEIFSIFSSGVVVNDAGQPSADFRIESDSDTHAFFVDSGANKIAIGTGTVGNSLLTIDGDVTTTSITASSTVSASAIHADNLIGNSAGPTGLHVQGEITASGNISSSATGSFGMLIVDQNITASGNISSSGTISANSGSFNYIESIDKIQHTGDANTGLDFASDTVSIQGNNVTIATFASNRVELNKRTLIDAHLTASGNISSSETVKSMTGSFNHIIVGNTQYNGNTFITSGDIVFDSSADIQLDAAGGNIEFKDAGTSQLTLDMDGTAGAQVIKLEVSGDDLIFKNQGGDSVLTLKSEGQTEIHSNVTASGNISSSGFIGAPIQLVTHAWYSAYAAADWGLDKLTNGDDNFGWADRAWDDAVDKADADAGNGNTGTFTNNDFNKGVRINHDVIDIELIGTLRPNSSVTQLNYYIYKGTPYAGGNTSTITFLASASSATTTTSRPNDIYITGSTGLQANKGDYLYIFANADLGSGNIKGSYTVTAKTRA